MKIVDKTANKVSEMYSYYIVPPEKKEKEKKLDRFEFIKQLIA